MCHDGNGHTTLSDANGIVESNFEMAVQDAVMPVFQAGPSGPSRGQVIIIHDIYGANVFYHDLARRLAKAGFTTFLPNLFVRQGELPEQSREAARARGGQLSYPQAMEDLGKLAERIEADGKIGVVGFCMGGTLVMHLASKEPRLSAGVIYYGFPANPNLSANRPSEPLRETSLMNMPLLGFWGDQDQGVGMDNVERLDRQLESAGKDYEFHIYPGLGHGYLTFDESEPAFEKSVESWARAEAFFAERLA